MTQNQPPQNSWKNEVYLIGAVGGLIFGLLAAYLYARSAEEDAERRGGKPERIKTMQLISLLLAALTLIRQIAELGKPKKK